MKAFELTAAVDSKHLLRAEVPETVSPGKVRLILLVPDEDDTGREWDVEFHVNGRMN